MTCKAYFFTHNGIVDHANQDSMLIGSRIVSNEAFGAVCLEKHNSLSNIFAVADGISSSKYSSIASRLALEELRKFVQTTNRFSARSAAERIQEKLANHAVSHPEHRGMGTTLAGVFFENDQAHIFNTGDSRVYLFRNGVLKQLSRDHTQAQRMLDCGEMTPEEFAECSDIYKMLEGYFVAGELEDDELMVSADKIAVQGGDVFLVCTDGLSDTLTDAEILSILSHDESLKEKAETLRKHALPQTRDNLSFILLENIDKSCPQRRI